MIWRTNSLEARLKKVFLLFLSFQAVCCYLFLITILPLWATISFVCIFGIFVVFTLRHLYNLLLIPLRRMSIQLEALQNGDYSCVAKPVFPEGIVGEFHRQLNSFGESLQQYKNNSDQKFVVLYQLIDQLNTPILVFDQKVQLSYANLAFIELFDQPWQTLRHASPSLLGLIKNETWQFSDQTKSQKWQVRHSMFLDQGQHYQLLIFINIHDALRESQIEAWQKLIRVLSHEIRNSLTPVATLAQGIHAKTDCPRTKQALELISDRCKHLQDFVSRYSGLHKPMHVAPKWIKAQFLYEQLAELFHDVNLLSRGTSLQIWGDVTLLQQVLINLVKNAIEADGENGLIEIIFSQGENYSEIRILDSGHGIVNPDNLFVPFYSTKPQGQGIGLSLSRHIIEQMDGYLSLSNRHGCVGACATIRLPRPIGSSSPKTQK